MVEAVRITKNERLRDLTGLAVGDNLEFVKRIGREVVSVSSNGRYLTMELLSVPGREEAIMYRSYFATPEMLRRGILNTLNPGSLAFCKDNPGHKEFYEQYLLRQRTAEAVA